MQESNKPLLHLHNTFLVKHLCIVDPKAFCPMFSDDQGKLTAMRRLVVMQGLYPLYEDGWYMCPLDVSSTAAIPSTGVTWPLGPPLLVASSDQ